ncbi:MAG: replication-associated recombination protein A [Bacillota bacterium]
MDIFTYNWEEQVKKDGPLARRMAPRCLDEFAGQEHLLSHNSPLRRLIEEDLLSSVIFYGPPGTGKTALARIIATKTKSGFIRLNAVTAGVKDVRSVIDEARVKRSLQGKRTILFIDEIHRFNKVQQDALLPAVEEGLVYLIGATTENPFFSLVPPLLSRTLIFTFESLSPAAVKQVLERALTDTERGLGRYGATLTQEALQYLVAMADGDARVALNALEAAVISQVDKEGKMSAPLGVEQLWGSLTRKNLCYDAGGDYHYDVISAFIKSIRGSDPDAALFWLARMLESGEDPLFVARRLVISASEDIGNADPIALVLAVAAMQAVQQIGLPEGRIPLAQVTTYLASAPKSNAVYLAINEAQAAIKKGPTGSVPPHLRDASYQGASRLGHGQGYLYPHDFPQHFVSQLYMPPELEQQIFYRPGEQGYEKELGERLKRWRLLMGKKGE